MYTYSAGSETRTVAVFARAALVNDTVAETNEKLAEVQIKEVELILEPWTEPQTAVSSTSTVVGVVQPGTPFKLLAFNTSDPHYTLHLQVKTQAVKLRWRRLGGNPAAAYFESDFIE
jgi:hypothetical protein